MLKIITLLALLVLAAFALILGISLGIGWLLTLILPFTLFESTLLALLAAFILIDILINILRNLPLSNSTPPPYFDAEEEYKEIPEERFFKTENDRIWENHYRHMMANEIYAEFQDAPARVASMNEKQTQELAIRLADIGVAYLKAKSPRATQLRLTRAVLVNQMKKMNQQPYSEDILELALDGINVFIDENFDDLLDSILTKDWQKKITF